MTILELFNIKKNHLMVWFIISCSFFFGKSERFGFGWEFIFMSHKREIISDLWFTFNISSQNNRVIFYINPQKTKQSDQVVKYFGTINKSNSKLNNTFKYIWELSTDIIFSLPTLEFDWRGKHCLNNSKQNKMQIFSLLSGGKCRFVFRIRWYGDFLS